MTEQANVNELLAEDGIIFTPVFSQKFKEWEYHVDFPDGDFAVICTGPEIDARWVALELWSDKIYEKEHIC